MARFLVRTSKNQSFIDSILFIFSRIPLYSTFKAIFFLYLALPQTQGSTYIYTIHLRPFFVKHEAQIDMAILEVRVKAYRFLQEKARSIWATMIHILTSGGLPDANATGVVVGGGGQTDQSSESPTMPAGPTQLLSSLWTTYGPGIVAGGTALLRQTAAATLPVGATQVTDNAADAIGRSNALNTPPGSSFFTDPILERRRQLEAELASLPPYPSTSSLPIPTTTIPPANNSPIRPGITPSSSSSSVRERVNSGRFEEIKGGDVEGYNMEDEPLIGGYHMGDANTNTNNPRKSAGWFGGWSLSSSGGAGSKERGSYERVKND